MSPERYWRTRRFPRYPQDSPLRALIYADETSTYPIRGRCRELGEGGAGVTLAEQLPTGEVVALELSPTLRVYAAVRYLRGFYHGFEFVMLRDRQRDSIRQLCKNAARRKKHAAVAVPHAGLAAAD